MFLHYVTAASKLIPYCRHKYNENIPQIENCLRYGHYNFRDGLRQRWVKVWSLTHLCLSPSLELEELQTGHACGIVVRYSRLQKSRNNLAEQWKPQLTYQVWIRLSFLLQLPSSYCKSVVVFHCQPCLLQDFCNLLYTFEHFVNMVGFCGNSYIYIRTRLVRFSYNTVDLYLLLL